MTVSVPEIYTCRSSSNVKVMVYIIRSQDEKLSFSQFLSLPQVYTLVKNIAYFCVIFSFVSRNRIYLAAQFVIKGH